ncbi:alpha/beta fold hydrolase [Streptomyces sp. NPDC012637]|uniref:alpha/beta fold hydrolase n=1 Tax=Streptomyces sp. NPDC012637 TaxID=3364842 RepID=UPI0036F045BC
MSIDTPSATVTSADGTVIAYERRGSGPSVVLVGGAFMTRGDSAGLATLLAERFTVLTYDRRGRGDSGDSPVYDVRREVEDLDALIQGPAGGSAMVFGMSSGAVLALEATARGSAVSRLALYEPPFVTDDSRPPLPDDYVERLTELVAKEAYGDAVAHFMTAAVGLPEEVVAGMRQAPFWAGMEAVARTLPYDGRIMGDTMSGRPLPVGRWASVTVPVLVGSGDAGAPHMLTGARELAASAGNYTLRVFPGEEHAIAPEVLAPALADFFAESATSAPAAESATAGEGHAA